MDNLDIIDIYEEQKSSEDEKFLNSLNTQLKVDTDVEKVTEDTEWIDVIEQTIPHIDAIFRNPNRFIVNEEDIVKIELARQVTVESVKHLAKHTNLIQDIDKDGSVRPSKILNINKEETYNTYENRLIYTLIINTKIFISQKKAAIEKRADVKEKNNKAMEFTSSGIYNNRSVSMSMHLQSDKISGGANKSEELLKRIKGVEERMTDLSSSDVYKTIDKLHVSLIRPPIKKTNVILKNVHFQYAMKLWNYLQENLEDKSTHVKNHDEITSNQELIRLTNETFMLNCMALNTLDEDENTKIEKSEKIKEQLTENMIVNLIQLNPTMKQEELQKMIGEKFAIIKYRASTNMAELEKIFKRHINKFIEKVEE